MAYFFIICVKKVKIFKRELKNGTKFVKKGHHYVDNVIRTRETSIILSPTSLFQAIIVLNVAAKFE